MCTRDRQYATFSLGWRNMQSCQAESELIRHLHRAPAARLSWPAKFRCFVGEDSNKISDRCIIEAGEEEEEEEDGEKEEEEEVKLNGLHCIVLYVCECADVIAGKEHEIGALSKVDCVYQAHTA